MTSESVTNNKQSSAGNGQAKRLCFEGPITSTEKNANPPPDNTGPSKKSTPLQKTLTTAEEFVGLLHNDLRSFVGTHLKNAIHKFLTFPYKDTKYQEVKATTDYAPSNCKFKAPS